MTSEQKLLDRMPRVLTAEKIASLDGEAWGDLPRREWKASLGRGAGMNDDANADMGMVQAAVPSNNACDTCRFASPGFRSRFPSDPEFFCGNACRVPKNLWEKSCTWRHGAVDLETGDLKPEAENCPSWQEKT